MRRALAFVIAMVELPQMAAGATKGGAEEDTFWYDWLACGMGKKPSAHFACTDAVREDFRGRMAARREIEENKCSLARGGRSSNSSRSSSRLRILDVGAGPLSTLGTDCVGQPIELFPVDLLAPQYDATLMKLHLQPRVRTLYAPMEALASHFARSFFDLVHCTNALDHAQDPVRAVEQMVSIVKPRHAVKVISWINESQMENGYGMHQWDMFADAQGHFMIAARGGQRVTDVTRAMSGTARVEVKLKAKVWHSHTISLQECAATWRSRACVMEVLLTKLSHGHGGKERGEHTG